jgi:hypothetical protein
MWRARGDFGGGWSAKRGGYFLGGLAERSDRRDGECNRLSFHIGRPSSTSIVLISVSRALCVQLIAPFSVVSRVIMPRLEGREEGKNNNL